MALAWPLLPPECPPNKPLWQACYHVVDMDRPSDRHARTISVLNLKGGVGKTHTVWMLTSVCQERSLKTLAIDLDTQANLSGSYLPEPNGLPGVETLFNPAIEPDATAVVWRTRFEHVSIIPSRPELAQFDLTNRHEWERSDGHLSLVEPLRHLRSSSRREKSQSCCRCFDSIRLHSARPVEIRAEL